MDVWVVLKCSPYKKDELFQIGLMFRPRMASVQHVPRPCMRTSDTQLISLIYIYGRSRPDGYLNKKLGIFALLYFHNVNYTTT